MDNALIVQYQNTMHIALTYDLKADYLKEGYSAEEAAEFDSIETINAIAEVLESLGHKVERIGHVRALMAALLAGKKWDLVFNIAEGLYGYGREALIPILLDQYQIPYTFSDPLVLTAALHKAATKQLMRDAGIATPEFVLVTTPEDISAIDLPYPLFAKPVAEGTSKGVTTMSRIENAAALKKTCNALLKQFNQPVLVETYLPGREFTVGLLGTGEKAEVVGVMEVHLSAKDKGIYAFETKAEYIGRVEYTLADDALAKRSGELALKAWRALGCRDGGRVDVRADASGVPHFIEINPLAGLNPADSDLPIMWRLQGKQYRDLIIRILESAQKRCR